MNSKERVRLAIDRRPTDRVPLGLYAIDHDTISKIIGRPTYVRNRCEFQVALWEGRRDEIAESMKRDVIDLYEKLDCVDLITFKEATYLPPSGYTPEDAPKKIAENFYEDSFGRVWQLVPEANDIAIVKDPTRPTQLPTYDPADFSARVVPTEDDPSCFELMDNLIAHFGGERYIAGYAGGLVALTLLAGTEYGLMTMAMQPEVVQSVNEKTVFEENIKDEWMIRPGVDGVMTEDDTAGTNGPLVSPAMFGELCFPYMKARIQSMKRYTSQVILHNCGNNLPLLEMFLDAGIDAYESIQTTSAMNVDVLTRKYGDRMCVWGAVPLEVLITGTRDETRKAVQECMEIGKRVPGFILGPSHSIAFNTRYDNFMAMLDEFVRLRDR